MKNISFQFSAKANNVDSENEDYYFYDYGNDPGENSGNTSSKNLKKSTLCLFSFKIFKKSCMQVAFIWSWAYPDM